MNSKNERTFQKWKMLLKFSIGIICVGYIVTFFTKNSDSILIVFNIDLLSIILIVFTIIITLLFYFLRFLIIVIRCSGQKIPFHDWVKTTIIARFLNLILSQSGNIYRAIYLKKTYQVNYTNYIIIYSSFAWIDTFLNIGAITILIAILNPKLKIGDYYAWNISLYLFLMTLVAPFVGRILLSCTSFKSPRITWIRDKVSYVVSTAINVSKDILFMGKISSLGLIVLFTNMIAYKILFNSFLIEVDFSTIAIFCVLLKIGNFITITPGNIGVQELAFGFLSQEMGVGMAEGIVVSIVGRLILTSITIVWAISIGGLGVIRKWSAYSRENVDEKL
jgi:uncharacterized membrane protein YbhN (UPF0104 family)